MKTHMKLGRAMVVFSLVFSVAQIANTAAAQSVRVGILDFPPFYEGTDPKNPGGIMLELLQKVLDRADVRYTIKAYPPKRLYQNLALGKTDVWMGVKGVPQYEGKVIYSDASITSVHLMIYTRDDTAPPPEQGPAEREKNHRNPGLQLRRIH